ncbi:hypothetical protein GCM10011577_02270 [Pseudarthrobacter polychromogenes]|uniref:Uncharacterized protein n=1 Tax=Pseudarthrobacter polychromogenes TaxID=1676 RepID=A0ABQ1X9E5_9MICC|nr:hypothetical protein GCM10011577_02270 [Pseudarthrobacter polychromogenes]
MIPVMTISQPSGRSRVIGGRAPAVLLSGSTVRSGAWVPLKGEMLGIGKASFSSGGPCPIVTPDAGKTFQERELVMLLPLWNSRGMRE